MLERLPTSVVALPPRLLIVQLRSRKLLTCSAFTPSPRECACARHHNSERVGACGQGRGAYDGDAFELDVRRILDRDHMLPG